MALLQHGDVSGHNRKEKYGAEKLTKVWEMESMFVMESMIATGFVNKGRLPGGFEPLSDK